ELAFGTLDRGQPTRGIGRDPDGPRVDHRVGKRTPNPPDRVGRELQATAMVERLYGADQADGPLLHEIVVGSSTPAIPLRKRVNESQVALDHLSLGREVTTFDALGELDLLGPREEAVGRAGHLTPPPRASD